MKKKYLLEIKNLWVKAEKKLILKEINLSISEGESHIIFGPNGSGKSTLLGAIMGLPNLKVIKGDIIFKGDSILGLPIYERARKGIGIGFQNPIAIRGVKLKKFLEIINTSQKEIQNVAKELNLKKLLQRDINREFSGGEKKTCEIMQLLLQKPDLALLDEPDSGIDVENIKIISKSIKRMLQKDLPLIKRRRSAIIITHSGNILDYVNMDAGYVMIDGKLVCGTNPCDIFDKIKERGYEDCYRCFSLGDKNVKK